MGGEDEKGFGHWYGAQRIAAARLLHEKGDVVVLSDRKNEAEFGNALDELRQENVEFRLGEDAQSLLPGVDLVVISPGVPIEHPAVAKAREMGIEVIGEVELAYRLSMDAALDCSGHHRHQRQDDNYHAAGRNLPERGQAYVRGRQYRRAICGGSQPRRGRTT